MGWKAKISGTIEGSGGLSHRSVISRVGRLGLATVVHMTILGIVTGGPGAGMIGLAATAPSDCPCSPDSSCGCKCCHKTKASSASNGKCSHCPVKNNGCQKNTAAATWQSDCSCGSKSPGVANSISPPKLLPTNAILLVKCVIWLHGPGRVLEPEHVFLQPPTPLPERSLPSVDRLLA